MYSVFCHGIHFSTLYIMHYWICDSCTLSVSCKWLTPCNLQVTAVRSLDQWHFMTGHHVINILLLHGTRASMMMNVIHLLATSARLQAHSYIGHFHSHCTIAQWNHPSVWYFCLHLCSIPSLPDAHTHWFSSVTMKGIKFNGTLSRSPFVLYEQRQGKISASSNLVWTQPTEYC